MPEVRLQMNVISCSSPRQSVPVPPDARASWFVKPNRLIIIIVYIFSKRKEDTMRVCNRTTNVSERKWKVDLRCTL